MGKDETRTQKGRPQVEIFVAVANLTIGSIAFWKVLLGCLWVVGIIVHSVFGGYRGSVEDVFFSESGNGVRDVVVVVSTIFWWLTAIIGAALMIFAIVGIAIDHCFRSRSSLFYEDDSL